MPQLQPGRIRSQAFAYGVYTYGGQAAKTDSKIATLAANGLGWLYVSVVAVRAAYIVAGIMLGNARKASKAALPDQHVYKIAGDDSKPYVLMENEGVHGEFNRAQRAVQNMNENVAQIFATMLLAGFVFPFQTFCCACGWGATRLMGMSGYIKSADDRMGGNLLSMLIYNCMEGMVLFAGVRAIMQE